MEYRKLTFEEFEKAFKSVKHSKAAWHDNIDSKVVISVYGETSYPLFMINEGIFPEQLKVAKVSPVFKAGNIEKIGNYRPILVLPIFSKILERTMYNRTHQYSKENDMFLSKQFGFQVNNSTHHTILNMTDDILTSFEKRLTSWHYSIDLSKALDAVNHNILLRKLELSGIKGKCLNWFKGYLKGRNFGGFGCFHEKPPN